jgi:hypothetical protein
MDVDIVAASEPSTLANKNPEGLLTLNFDEPGRAARQVEEFATGLSALLYSFNHGIKAIPRKKLERADKAELLPTGRVLLHRAAGQHAEKEFERVS